MIYKGVMEMIVKQVIMICICIFFVLGVADHFIGNRLGIGAEFKRGFAMAGPIILAEVGNICIAPFIGSVCGPFVSKVFGLINSDPSVFIGLIMGPDSGYKIAVSMAADPVVGAWSGCVLGAMLGGLLSFSIPCGLGIITSQDQRPYSIGCMSAVIAAPLSCFVGGLLAGIQVGVILINLIIPIIVTLAIIIGLGKFPETTMKVFVIIGRIATLVILTGLTLAAIRQLTGYEILPGLAPLSEGFAVIGSILVTVAGVMSMTEVIRRVFRKPIARAGEKMGLDEFCILGIMQGLCTIIPGYIDYHKMNPRGKVVFAAFVASASSILGVHLAYIGVYAPTMLVPTMAAKILACIIAIPLSLSLHKRILNKN